MIRVTIDIVPYGDPDHVETLHTLVVANTEPASFGHFVYRFWVDKATDSPPDGVVFHRRDDGALKLVRRVLEQVVER